MGVVYFTYIFYAVFIFKEEIFKFFKIKQFEKLLVNPMYHLCADVLQKNSHYFQNLDKATKDIFIQRTINFIDDVGWVGFQGFEIKERHKILVSATAVQLTFGYEKTRFNNLQRIFIAPEQFYSRILEKDVKGLTMPIAIYLSWADFEQGINIENDAINLGLHEFTHALDIQATLSFDSLDDHYINNIQTWNLLSNNVFELLNLNENYSGFLREYAKVNRNEFFAVVVEYFFERPQLLKDNEAKLYESLCLLLNQNPLNNKVNFAIESEQLLETSSITFKFKFSNFHYLFILSIGFICLMSNQPVLSFLVSLTHHYEIMFYFSIVLILNILNYKTFKLNKNSIGLFWALGVMPIILLIVKYFNFSF